MKILKPWEFELRKWQARAFMRVLDKLEKGSRDFLCVATPGAGKTIYALRVAHYLFSEKLIDRVAILCPTEHLKKQWAESAFKVGIELDPNFENSNVRETSDYMGVSITYAAVGRSPNVHKKNCDVRRTLVIFDEVHHLGDNLSWGDGTRMAFRNAVFRLSISGTPFRRDTNPIPFVRYSDLQSVSDYTYGYAHAIMDKVCRPVHFPAFEGHMEWRVKNKIYKSDFSRQLNNAQASERLRTALDPSGKWLKMVISDADEQLNQIRHTEQHDAGGLVIAMDQSHARRVSALIGRITGMVPTVVVSDDNNASKKIEEFSNSNQKWLVAVKMVSEGVDIPRLRVGVYATNIKSELFFRQAVGRFVRVQKEHKGDQLAYFYIPKEAVLVYYAKEIEYEREHYLKLDDSESIFESELERKKAEKDDERFEAIFSVATDKTQYELDFGADFARPEKENIPAPTVMLQQDEVKPMYEIINMLKDDVNDLAKLLAKKRGNGKIDWDIAHREWMNLGGKNIEVETREELLKRKKWILRQLMN